MLHLPTNRNWQGAYNHFNISGLNGVKRKQIIKPKIISENIQYVLGKGQGSKEWISKRDDMTGDIRSWQVQ